MKHFLYLKVIILALILSFTACGGSGSSRGGDSFIPVMDITGVNTVATACTHLALSGNVEPSDATNQTIIWSVQSAGSTGATISGNTLDTLASGTVKVLATIANGSAEGTDYTKPFIITVSKPAEIKGMVWVEGGTFIMGSPSTEKEREPYTGADEKQHSVTVSGFYMGIYPVTQAEYEAVVGAGKNPSNFTTDAVGDAAKNRPVERVTWFDAVEYCNKLSTNKGRTPVYTITDRDPSDGTYPITSATVTANWNANGYRLPTEAEWEYACRGDYSNKATVKATMPFGIGNGKDMLPGTANFDTQYTYTLSGGHKDEGATNGTHHVGRTSAVGKYAANSYGLYDMHGNVWEWCWDWYDTYPADGKVDYRGPDSSVGTVFGAYRVLRGGSWDNLAQYMRSACRGRFVPDDRNDSFGFRVVCRP